MTSTPHHEPASEEMALKPCAHCGSAGHAWSGAAGYAYGILYHVGCTYCSSQVAHTLLSGAIAAWNRRASDPEAERSARIAAEAEVARCHARLEIDHHFVMNKAGDDLVRVEVPLAERPDGIDGIECRNATIRLLEERIAAAEERASRTRKEALEEAAKTADNAPQVAYKRFDGQCHEAIAAAIRALSQPEPEAEDGAC